MADLYNLGGADYAFRVAYSVLRHREEALEALNADDYDLWDARIRDIDAHIGL